MKFKKTILALATVVTLTLNILNLTGIAESSSNTNGESNNYSISVYSDDVSYDSNGHK